VKLYHIQTGEIVNTVKVNPEAEPKIKSIHPDLTSCKYIITDRDGCGYLFDVVRVNSDSESMLRKMYASS